MAPGSVIVDIAAERGGNCELTRAGETVVHNGVTILGPVNLPPRAPYHASQMYAPTSSTFLKYLMKDGKSSRIDREDEIVRETLVTHGGSGPPRVRAAWPWPRREAGEDSLNYEFGLIRFHAGDLLGLELIRKVSPLLHTPLMSLTNAISASRWWAPSDHRREGVHAVARAGLHRGHRGHHQPGQRLPDHRPHAQDVQEAGAGQEMASSTWCSGIYSSPPRCSSSPEVDELAGHGAPRRDRRRIGMLLASSARCCAHESSITSGSDRRSSSGGHRRPHRLLMPMTAVPQRTAISHACGALASALVGTAEYYRQRRTASPWWR
jgi:hypothetical protein